VPPPRDPILPGSRPRVPVVRAEPREIVELKKLKAEQPDLAPAADLHIEIFNLQKRIQARVSVPWLQFDPEWRTAELTAGRPLLRFHEIPLEWTDVRLAVRQTADILFRFDAIEAPDSTALQAIVREEGALEPLVRNWYLAKSERHAGVTHRESMSPISIAAVQQTLDLAMRPFLMRAVEVIVQQTDLAEWRRSYCPVCGGDPEFAVVTDSGDRRLICGRCACQWPFGHWTCPHCLNDDRSRVTSFASRDGRYRIYACESCRRYIKAYDARGAGRPVMLEVDTVATLPLDAAAMQKGYSA
jgi:hypothetical protein